MDNLLCARAYVARSGAAHYPGSEEDSKGSSAVARRAEGPADVCSWSLFLQDCHQRLDRRLCRASSSRRNILERKILNPLTNPRMPKDSCKLIRAASCLAEYSIYKRPSGDLRVKSPASAVLASVVAHLEADPPSVDPTMQYRRQMKLRLDSQQAGAGAPPAPAAAAAPANEAPAAASAGASDDILILCSHAVQSVSQKQSCVQIAHLLAFRTCSSVYNGVAEP